MKLWERREDECGVRFRCSIHEGTAFERFYEVDAQLIVRAKEDKNFRREMVSRMWKVLLG